MNDFNIKVDPEAGRRGTQEADRVDELRDARRWEFLAAWAIVIGFAIAFFALLVASNQAALSRVPTFFERLLFYALASVSTVSLIIGVVAGIYAKYKRHVFLQ